MQPKIFSKKKIKNFTSEKKLFFFAFSFLKLKKKLLTCHGSILRNGQVIALSVNSVCAPLCAPWCTIFFKIQNHKIYYLRILGYYNSIYKVIGPF